MSCPSWVIFTEKKDFRFIHVMYWRKPSVCMYKYCWQYQLIFNKRVTTAAKYKITLSGLVSLFIWGTMFCLSPNLLSVNWWNHTSVALFCCLQVEIPRGVPKVQFHQSECLSVLLPQAPLSPLFIGQSSLYTFGSEVNAFSSSLF
jgi:hypothetical protein